RPSAPGTPARPPRRSPTTWRRRTRRCSDPVSARALSPPRTCGERKAGGHGTSPSAWGVRVRRPAARPRAGAHRLQPGPQVRQQLRVRVLHQVVQLVRILAQVVELLLPRLVPDVRVTPRTDRPVPGNRRL